MESHLNLVKRNIFSAFLFFLVLVVLFGAVELCNAAEENVHSHERPRLHEAQVPAGTPIIEVSDVIEVRNEVFDGEGALYRWTGEGDCSQAERMPPMFRLFEGATLRNLYMENAPDGVHVRGPHVRIQNIVNIDVCEDAVTSSVEEVQDLTIENSKFYQCEDKALQLNFGSNITIRNNEFYHCTRPVRVKEDTNNVKVRNNLFYDVVQAVRVTGGTASVRASRVQFAEYHLDVEDSGRIHNQGRHSLQNIQNPDRSRNNGQIVR